jgi:hypothetical protein
MVWAASAGLLAVSLVLGADRSGGGLEPAVKAELVKIAAAIEKGDMATAKSKAAALVKKIEELNEVMCAFKLRSSKGYGVGSKPGVSTPDGIELRLIAIGRDGITKNELEAEGAGLIESAYITAAIAEVAILKAPLKDKGAKRKKDWVGWSEGMRDSARDLAASIKTGAPKAVQGVTTRLLDTCNNCHSVFKK